MSGSHNGPSMYLFGTSWENGKSALCVLHSLRHSVQKQEHAQKKLELQQLTQARAELLGLFFRCSALV